MTTMPFAPTSRPAAIPVHDDPAVGDPRRLGSVLAVYFVGAEEGATSLILGMYVHEFVHDGRHLPGFPCH